LSSSAQSTPQQSPTKSPTLSQMSQPSYKIILHNYMRANFNQSPTYIQLGNNHVGVVCPTGLGCKGQIINGYNIIGIGHNPIIRQGEEIAAYNTLKYFNYI
jgi:hypothetical protein